ncbi:CCA tRNA nucleotidyltransferase, mitochondrial [Agyrium rufum]|nr:CCA tRNA nucleotidyltransferase, mitochondrial [Agyrium rufum]
MSSLDGKPASRPVIALTEDEELLRQLLLDAAEYAGTQDGITKPVLRFTGGWVRDRLLGAQSVDIDVGISSMTGFTFGNLMKEYLQTSDGIAKYGQHELPALSKIEANPEKSKHLETITTKIMGYDVDLVNLRKEVYLDTSRNPLMEFGTAEEDAQRRDATVNALFYNLSTSEVEDFTGKGLEDMQNQIIRTPLPPHQTFEDDPLRVLRCIRFASRLGYRIDAAAESSMGDQGIKDALRVKISRERVGTEVEKMLRGPDPHAALVFIDRLNLYNTIFTNPARPDALQISTQDWHRAYDGFSIIAGAFSETRAEANRAYALKGILLLDKEHEYLGWILSCVVLATRLSLPKGWENVSAKGQNPVAAIIAREGLRIDNKVMKIIKNAVQQMPEIQSLVHDGSPDESTPETSSKRKRSVWRRDILGLKLRKMGEHWRSSVVFAMMDDLLRAEDETSRENVFNEYAAWLDDVRELDLLDAHAITPLISGTELKKALQAGPGIWLVQALDVAMLWQLRNPGNNNIQEGIDEVASRKEEFRLT